MALSTDQKTRLKLYVPILVTSLQANNVKPELIPYIIAQMILETGYFKNRSIREDNNPAGITWNPNYLKRPGTSKGSARPESERENPNYNNYVRFDNFDIAVKDYLRIINKSPGLPVDATSVDDFAARLKKNRYYRASQLQYTENLKSIYKRIAENVDLAALLKKKNSVNMAAISPIILGLFVGYILYKSK